MKILRPKHFGLRFKYFCLRSKHLGLFLLLTGGTLFTACSNHRAEQATAGTATANTATAQSTPAAIVNAVATDTSGQTLTMRFDNDLNSVTLLWDGQRITLQGQRAASGIWYANDHYELRGKGPHVVLRRGDSVIFDGNTPAKNHTD